MHDPGMNKNQVTVSGHVPYHPINWVGYVPTVHPDFIQVIPCGFHTYICMYIYTLYIYVNVYVHMYTYTYIHTHTYTHLSIHTFPHKEVWPQFGFLGQ